MRFSTIAVALACLAVPTLARAHAGNDDPNVVHACVDRNGDVRIVAVDGSCISSPRPKAETPVHWAIQGPQGVAGIPGTPGAKGDTGTQGLPGVPGRDGKDATRPAGPCFDNINRYVDCGNGTVTDTVTGLIWLKQADCLGFYDWAAANAAAAGLKDGGCGGTLTDGSSPGDWRLPTIDEWRATLARAAALGCVGPGLTDDAGTGCYGDGSASSFSGVPGERWSSSSSEVYPTAAGYAFAFGGPLAGFGVPKSSPLRTWPVRAR